MSESGYSFPTKGVGKNKRLGTSSGGTRKGKHCPLEDPGYYREGKAIFLYPSGFIAEILAIKDILGEVKKQKFT